MVKSGCGQSGYVTLKSTASEEWTWMDDGINWFFACWYMITKIKSWSKMFCLGMIKTGCGQSGHGMQKMNRWKKVMFSCWYKFRKAKCWFNYFGVVWSEMAMLFSSWGPKISCTLRVNFWMLIVMQQFLVRLISYSLIFKCWGSTAVVLLIFWKLRFHILNYAVVWKLVIN